MLYWSCRSSGREQPSRYVPAIAASVAAIGQVDPVLIFCGQDRPRLGSSKEVQMTDAIHERRAAEELARAKASHDRAAAAAHRGLSELHRRAAKQVSVVAFAPETPAEKRLIDHRSIR